MTRSPEKARALRDLGAEPVVCNAFDADALRALVVAFQPGVVVNELSDLPDKLAATNEANARMRREGTRNLLAAANAAGASRFIAQSVAWQLSGEAGAAVNELERLVLAASALSSDTDGSTGPAHTTNARSRSRPAFTSTRPPAAPSPPLTQPPESSKSPIASHTGWVALQDLDAALERRPGGGNMEPTVPPGATEVTAPLTGTPYRGRALSD